MSRYAENGRFNLPPIPSFQLTAPFERTKSCRIQIRRTVPGIKSIPLFVDVRVTRYQMYSLRRHELRAKFVFWATGGELVYLTYS